MDNKTDAPIPYFVEDHCAAVKAIIALVRQYVLSGGSEEYKERVRCIGIGIFAAGGFEKMQAISHECDRALGSCDVGAWLNELWDGIGGWAS